MPLHHLIFDASDDGDDTGTWEAMASVRPEGRAALMEEVHAVLRAAEAQAPGPRGPLDEGGVWDADLQVQPEDGGWTTVTLTLVGPLAWGEALLAGLDD